MNESCENCRSQRSGLCYVAQPPEPATLGWCFAWHPQEMDEGGMACPRCGGVDVKQDEPEGD